MRESYLPFALPDIGQEEIDAVAETMRTGWLTTGPSVQAFEAEFASAVGAVHAVALNSCTAAMHLALEAIGLKPGDEVLTTPYTFAATAEVIRYFGATPVFVDIEPETFNLDPSRLHAKISQQTRAILPVHFGGLPSDLDAICTIANRYDLRVIDDAAHCFPSSYRGKQIGTGTDVTCFSFYATKTITTGEGGMLCTDNADIAERCRIMSLHGISKDAWKRYSAEGNWYYEIVAPGYKYNMTDTAAAMGRVQLRKAGQMRARRAEIASRYSEAFADEPALHTPPIALPRCLTCSCTSKCTHAWHLYALRLNLSAVSCDRGAFISNLKDRNIGTSVHFIPLHIHPYYRDRYGFRPEDFPEAYRAYQREISLPIYSKMTDKDVSDVIDAVLETVRTNRKRAVFSA